MKITRNQLRQIIQEALEDKDFEDIYPGMDDIYPGADERGDPDSWDHFYDEDEDEDGDGIPDDLADTMDPDQKVQAILGKVRELLEDAEEIARLAPDHQNKGEGAAMFMLNTLVNNLHQMYGTEYWT